MVLRFKILLICILAMVCAACSGGGDSQAGAENKIRVAVHIDMTSLDPREAGDVGTMAIHQMLFEGLTRLGPDNRPRLAGAESIETSDDSLTVTIRLRENSWSDGQPVTAQDYASSWRQQLAPNFPSPFAYLLYPIKGARALREGTGSADELGIEVIDARTLRLHLAHPTPWLQELLAVPFSYPVPSHIESWAESEENYVSNGPYSVAELRYSDRISLLRNEHYWDAANTGPDGVELLVVPDFNTAALLFDNGEIDLTEEIPLDRVHVYAGTPNLVEVDIGATYMLLLNTEHPALKNMKLRKALSLALDRDAIVEHVMQGGELPSGRLLSPSIMPVGDALLAHDPVQARELLTEALGELGMELADIQELQFSYNYNDSNHRVAQAVQEQWHEVFGLAPRLQSVEWKVHLQNLAQHQFDIARLGWISVLRDPMFILEIFDAETSGNNYGQWIQPKYGQLLQASNFAATPAERLELLREAEDLLLEEMPTIPVFHSKMQFLVSDRLQGMSYTGPNGFDLRWAYLNTPEQEN